MANILDKIGDSVERAAIAAESLASNTQGANNTQNSTDATNPNTVVNHAQQARENNGNAELLNRRNDALQRQQKEPVSNLATGVANAVKELSANQNKANNDLKSTIEKYLSEDAKKRDQEEKDQIIEEVLEVLNKIFDDLNGRKNDVTPKLLQSILNHLEKKKEKESIDYSTDIRKGLSTLQQILNKTVEISNGIKSVQSVQNTQTARVSSAERTRTLPTQVEARQTEKPRVDRSRVQNEKPQDISGLKASIDNIPKSIEISLGKFFGRLENLNRNNYRGSLQMSTEIPKDISGNSFRKDQNPNTSTGVNLGNNGSSEVTSLGVRNAFSSSKPMPVVISNVREFERATEDALKQHRKDGLTEDLRMSESNVFRSKEGKSTNILIKYLERKFPLIGGFFKATQSMISTGSSILDHAIGYVLGPKIASGIMAAGKLALGFVGKAVVPAAAAVSTSYYVNRLNEENEKKSLELDAQGLHRAADEHRFYTKTATNTGAVGGGLLGGAAALGAMTLGVLTGPFAIPIAAAAIGLGMAGGAKLGSELANSSELSNKYDDPLARGRALGEVLPEYREEYKNSFLKELQTLSKQENGTILLSDDQIKNIMSTGNVQDLEKVVDLLIKNRNEAQNEDERLLYTKGLQDLEAIATRFDTYFATSKGLEGSDLKAYDTYTKGKVDDRSRNWWNINNIMYAVDAALTESLSERIRRKLTEAGSIETSMNTPEGKIGTGAVRNEYSDTKALEDANKKLQSENVSGKYSLGARNDFESLLNFVLNEPLEGHSELTRLLSDIERNKNNPNYVLPDNSVIASKMQAFMNNIYKAAGIEDPSKIKGDIGLFNKIGERLLSISEKYELGENFNTSEAYDKTISDLVLEIKKTRELSPQASEPRKFNDNLASSISSDAGGMVNLTESYKNTLAMYDDMLKKGELKKHEYDSLVAEFKETWGSRIEAQDLNKEKETEEVVKAVNTSGSKQLDIQDATKNILEVRFWPLLQLMESYLKNMKDGISVEVGNGVSTASTSTSSTGSVGLSTNGSPVSLASSSAASVTGLNNFKTIQVGNKKYLIPEGYNTNSYTREKNLEVEKWMANMLVEGGSSVSSRFGGRNAGVKGASSFHGGMDFAAATGQGIRNAVGGEVIFSGQQRDSAGNLTGYGNYVKVRGDDGLIYTYGHMSQRGVEAGQRIEAGQLLGQVGNSGTSGGSHLHFDVRDQLGRIIATDAWAKMKMEQGLTPTGVQSSQQISGTQVSGVSDLSVDMGRLYNELKAKGLNDNAIIGIMANAKAESGFNSQRVQGDFSRGHAVSSNYAAKVDSGAIGREQFATQGPGGGGFGLFQFTDSGLKRELYDNAKAAGKSIGDIGVQVSTMWNQLSKSTKDKLLNARSAEEAAKIFTLEYERPANKQQKAEERAQMASQLAHDIGVQTNQLNGAALQSSQSPIEPNFVAAPSEISSGANTISAQNVNIQSQTASLNSKGLEDLNNPAAEETVDNKPQENVNLSDSMSLAKDKVIETANLAKSGIEKMYDSVTNASTIEEATESIPETNIPKVENVIRSREAAMLNSVASITEGLSTDNPNALGMNTSGFKPIESGGNLYAQMYNTAMAYSAASGQSNHFMGDSWLAQEYRVKAGLQERNTALDSYNPKEIWKAYDAKFANNPNATTDEKLDFLFGSRRKDGDIFVNPESLSKVTPQEVMENYNKKEQEIIQNNTPLPSISESMTSAEIARIDANTRSNAEIQSNTAKTIADAVKPKDSGKATPTEGTSTTGSSQMAGPMGDEETRAVSEYVLRYIFGENVNGSGVLSIF